MFAMLKNSKELFLYQNNKLKAEFEVLSWLDKEVQVKNKESGIISKWLVNNPNNIRSSTSKEGYYIQSKRE